jgi:hypothetical protein
MLVDLKDWLLLVVVTAARAATSLVALMVIGPALLAACFVVPPVWPIAFYIMISAFCVRMISAGRPIRPDHNALVTLLWWGWAGWVLFYATRRKDLLRYRLQHYNLLDLGWHLQEEERRRQWLEAVYRREAIEHEKRMNKLM